MSSWYYNLQLEFSSAAIAACVEFAARLRAIRWSLFTSRWVSAPGMTMGDINAGMPVALHRATPAAFLAEMQHNLSPP
jgi:hypothetical protein